MGLSVFVVLISSLRDFNIIFFDFVIFKFFNNRGSYIEDVCGSV